MTEHRADRFRVVIVGNGLAALEGALALRAIAGDHVAITMVAAEDSFVYRPARVREPVGGSTARRYPLVEIAADIDVALHHDTVVRVDAGAHRVCTITGVEHHYDALLLAVGARPQVRFEYALTLDDRRLDEQLHGLVQDVEGGRVERLAFIAPRRLAWPVPLYELALMTARRARSMGEPVAITLATPEPAPLAAFGAVVSSRISQILHKAGIVTITAAQCATPAPNHVEFTPGGETVAFDRIVALPELYGPALVGLPCQDTHGFLPVDAFCRVVGLPNVFAAGDATDLPVKHGGLAAQQADVAAAAMAAMAGAGPVPEPLRPELRGILLGAGRPLYLSADLGGAHSAVSNEPTWSPASQVAARYLSPYLQSRDRLADSRAAALDSPRVDHNGGDGRARGATQPSA